ncbi:MAG TPA: acid phosphatase, partial [Acidimicrobiia bacterium]|nr:acid phosphatase [Acidimicrobiia bacterium]
MVDPEPRRTALVAAVLLLAAIAAGAGALRRSSHPAATPVEKIRHIVVIYQENHSFDSLWAGWPGVDQAGAGPAQVGQDGAPLSCLP